MGLRPGAWKGGWMGGGTVPIRIERSWLTLYHRAVDEVMAVADIPLEDIFDTVSYEGPLI